jgi:hypothetical protein
LPIPRSRRACCGPRAPIKTLTLFATFHNLMCIKKLMTNR